MTFIKDYQQYFLKYLVERTHPKDPKSLYNPISYILKLGGKRLRPVLVMMIAEAFGSTKDKAVNAAMAVEVFHNFSLVHDDIMDEAPIRRGEATVHKKWNVNTGILSGDAMLIQSYQHLEKYEGKIFKELVQLFSQTAIEVCEGQQYDIDFETRNDVSLPEYLKMIEYKTAVLVAAAMKMGAIVAETSEENKTAIYDFGRFLGIAFQLQDDYLDTFGDPKHFGKQIGGDIIENKKTFLYLKALENASLSDKKELSQLYTKEPVVDSNNKIKTVQDIFKKTEADKDLKKEIKVYTEKAFKILEKIPISSQKKQLLIDFGSNLMQREV